MTAGDVVVGTIVSRTGTSTITQTIIGLATPRSAISHFILLGAAASLVRRPRFVRKRVRRLAVDVRGIVWHSENGTLLEEQCFPAVLDAAATNDDLQNLRPRQ